MPEITLCPHYLVDYPYENPDDIENNIIHQLLELIEIIESDDNIILVVSKEILEISTNGYPWNLFEDNKWEGVLTLWSSIISPFLIRSKPLSHECQELVVETKLCKHTSDKVYSIFENFLKIFGKYSIAKKKHEEAIFTDNILCSYPSEYKEFLIVNNTYHNLNILKNPWLRVYPLDSLLPIKGEYKFIPPSNWRDSLTPFKNHKEPYGYIDNLGRVWKWDLQHKDHWDVQLCSKESSRGNYLNITPNGELLERK
ncbi:polymorphic toxin type 17 domain-containing protein [Acinetobacter junii]|uniref:polymorphic toxin type 17 domain-containing protein n=1 Tax=Acinetobacter junii TaxID=40215 RepID=UPI00285836B1|nr:polymorphic toxin type 17 domain-containing protein [Acinetobacter junii]MDR7654237.1 polymorphic toxin type 17 domain-containing protein [Acinetobacter junii]